MTRDERAPGGPDVPKLALAAGLIAAGVYLWRRARAGEVETDRLTAIRLGQRP